MKKLFCLCIVVMLILFQHLGINAQNLVPNYSFELYDTCPYSDGQINFVTSWYNPTTGSPDYLNSCTSYLWMGVPSNFWGFQYPKTGNAYAGIFTYSSISFSSPPQREYIQVMLTDTLIADQNYCVDFYVSAAEFPNITNYKIVAITELGLYFSNAPVSLNSADTLSYIPQITSPPGIFLSDTANWMHISGNYTASGGEQYITIGNFKGYSTDTIVFANGTMLEARSYYYIDDVSIVACNVGIDEMGKDEGVSIYPNPATTSLTLTHSKGVGTVAIYDVLGELLWSGKITKEKTEIDINAFSSGVYFVRIQNDKKIINRKFIKQ